MLHITPFQLILGGRLYELKPQQVHAIETQLRGMAAPASEWGFSHWSEAAACERLTQAGYDLVSPTQRGLAEAAESRTEPVNAREATSAPVDRVADLLKERQRLRDELEDATRELADLKGSIEGRDAEQVKAAIRRAEDLTRLSNAQAQRIVNLEAREQELRGRLVIARDAAREGQA